MESEYSFPLWPAKFADQEVEVDITSPHTSGVLTPSPVGSLTSVGSPASFRDPRVRRRLNRSSDEEPLEHALENLHYERFKDPLIKRIVAPAPHPFRLPLLTFDPPPEDVKKIELPWETICSNIHSILTSFGFRTFSVSLECRRPTVEPTSFNELTILICADVNSNWNLAMDKIRSGLRSSHKPFTSSLSVEMLSNPATGRWRFHPLSDDSLVTLWNQKMFERVRQTIKHMSWWTINFLDMSFTYPNGTISGPKPTVVILVPVAPWHKGWTSLEATIGRIFDAEGYGNIMVHVRQANFSRSCEVKKGRELDPQHYFSKYAFLGQSIGPPGQNQETASKGTAGPIVVLESRDGKTAPCVVSCFNVVNDSWPPQLPGSLVTEARTKGIHPSAHIAFKHRVMYPNMRQHLLNLDHHEYEKQEDSKAGYHESAAQHARMIENITQTGLQEFGRVAAGSGDHYKRVIKCPDGQTCKADWALIAITRGRVPPNEGPDEPNKLPEALPLNFPNDCKRHYKPQKTHLWGLADVKATIHDCDHKMGEGRYVYRIGAASGGITASKRCRTVSACKLGDEEEGWAGTIEWAFLDEDRGDVHATGPGDSGSAVFDNYGRWVGQVFAGHAAQNLVYVTPVHRLVEDIEHVTGCRIRFPQMHQGEYLGH